MTLSTEPLIGAAAIQGRIRELAADIRAHYGDREIVLVAVLSGAFHFASDLMRALGPPTALEFIRAKRYAGALAQEGVKFLVYPQSDLKDRHVLLVEDILDTGVTARAVLDYLSDAQPASLRCCALLDKPARREAGVSGDFIGFVVPDRFVVGYGLDYNEQYRELPGIHVLETSPDAGGFTS